jgi:hypothetical protein
MDIRSFSLPELIRLAFQWGLISDYRMAPRRITLYQRDGDILFEGDPVEARFFLMGIATERTRAVDHTPPPDASQPGQ